MFCSNKVEAENSYKNNKTKKTLKELIKVIKGILIWWGLTYSEFKKKKKVAYFLLVAFLVI